MASGCCLNVGEITRRDLVKPLSSVTAMDLCKPSREFVTDEELKKMAEECGVGCADFRRSWESPKSRFSSQIS